MRLAGAVLCLLAAIGKANAADRPAPATPMEMATAFLDDLNKANSAAAIRLWDSKVTGEKVAQRLEKIGAKFRKLGGIKRVDVRSCEPRRTKQFEEKTGEKIEVVPVEIICGDENLILAVFSIRRTADGYRIFQLESLKEWGGTASLDDELHYAP